MNIYEFSVFKEWLFNAFWFFPAGYVIFLLLRYGSVYLKGRSKFFILPPILIIISNCLSLVDNFTEINFHSYLIENNELLILKGQLVSVEQEQKKGFYSNSLDTPVYFEQINVSGNVLFRASPRLHSGQNGCLITALKESLNKHIGNIVEIKYIEKEFKDVTYPTFCILSVKVIK